MTHNNGPGGCEPNHLVNSSVEYLLLHTEKTSLQGRLLYTQSPSPSVFSQPHTRHRQDAHGPGWTEETCPCRSDARIQPARRKPLRDLVADALFWTDWHTGQGVPPGPQFFHDLDVLKHDEETDGQLPDEWVAEFDERYQSWYVREAAKLIFAVYHLR